MKYFLVIFDDYIISHNVNIITKNVEFYIFVYLSYQYKHAHIRSRNQVLLRYWK